MSYRDEALEIILHYIMIFLVFAFVLIISINFCRRSVFRTCWRCWCWDEDPKDDEELELEELQVSRDKPALNQCGATPTQQALMVPCGGAAPLGWPPAAGRGRRPAQCSMHRGRGAHAPGRGAGGLWAASGAGIAAGGA